MKNIYFMFISLISIFSFSQELGPALYQTWYLTEIYPNDGYPDTIFVSETEPDVSPFMTITENLEFIGVGACNSFTGAFSYNQTYEYLETLSFSATEMECETESQTYLEGAFFTTIQEGGWHNMTITEIENGLTLIINTPSFGFAIFTNFSLSSKEFDPIIPQVSIVPNPSSSVVKVQSQDPIIFIRMYDMNGKFIKSIYNNFEQINIENLEKGVYLLKIKTEKGEIMKKIIKS